MYRGTAPLVRATAGSLGAATMAALRRVEVGVLWWNGSALVPLKDKDGRAVVGAVAVAAQPDGETWRRGAFGGFALPVFFLAVLFAFSAVRAGAQRPSIRVHAAIALLVGLVAYANARSAARDATDRWLEQTRLLVQEATARLPVIVEERITSGPSAEKIPPPCAGAPFAVLPLTVVRSSVSVPVPDLKMPPPEAPTPPVIVRPTR